jgi:hypothetical protein
LLKVKVSRSRERFTMMYSASLNFPARISSAGGLGELAALVVAQVAGERSVAEGGRPVEVPDFTRGPWKPTSPLPSSED